MLQRARGTLLHIFIDEGDRHGTKPLFMAIVEALKNAGFPGATVLKGIEGYGLRKVVHAARAFEVATDLPVLIEVIEDERRILEFIPTLREMIPEGLLTLEHVDLIRVIGQKHD